MTNFRKLKNQDWLITIVAGILAFLSIILIFSTTFNASNPLEGQNAVYRQIIFIIVGFAIYFVISIINISWIKQAGVSYGAYLVILFLLVYLIFFGEEIQNTQRWIALGPFSFQPAEFAKLSLMVTTAYLFSEDVSERNIIQRIVISTVLALIYSLLIFRQPSLGNALINLIIWGAVVAMAVPLDKKSLLAIGVSILSFLLYFEVGIFGVIASASFLPATVWKIFIVASTGSLFLALYVWQNFNRLLLGLLFSLLLITGPVVDFAWNNVIEDYQKSRVESFIGGFETDPLDQDYQVRQSLIAIGSGRLTGQGYMQGGQSTLKVLPFAHTDFIFAAHAEQFGFVGVVILLSLYGVLVGRSSLVLFATSDQYSKLLVSGAIIIITSNIFINISMNMGLIPVTGVPLPLISYGGSSVILIMCCLGLIQSVKISTDPKELLEKFTWKVDL